MLSRLVRTLLATSALVLGALAAWLSLSIRHKQATPEIVQQIAPAPALQQVLVAAEDLPRGSVMAASNVQWQTWPEAAIAPGYISEAQRPDAPASLVGSVLREPLGKGQPVRDNQFVGATRAYLSSVLPHGKRAMAVRISAEHAAGGFVLPDDRVDVIGVTHTEGTSPTDRRHSSRTLLRNIRVLAVDQTVGTDKQADPQSASGRTELAVVGKTATLEVDAQQAEALATGEAAGSLVLSLRSAADSAEASTVGSRSLDTIRIIRAEKIDVAGR